MGEAAELGRPWNERLPEKGTPKISPMEPVCRVYKERKKGRQWWLGPQKIFLSL